MLASIPATALNGFGIRSMKGGGLQNDRMAVHKEEGWQNGTTRCNWYTAACAGRPVAAHAGATGAAAAAASPPSPAGCSRQARCGCVFCGAAGATSMRQRSRSSSRLSSKCFSSVEEFVERRRRGGGGGGRRGARRSGPGCDTPRARCRSMTALPNQPHPPQGTHSRCTSGRGRGRLRVAPTAGTRDSAARGPARHLGTGATQHATSE